MTAIDSAPDQAVAPALTAVADAADRHELEAAWTAGLRGQRDSADRDRILAAAGRRLGVFDDVADDRLRRRWLDDVVGETRLRGDRPLDQELAPVVTAEIREAFARAEDDLAELRTAVAAGAGTDDFSARSPLAAARLRDLGRIAERLRGTGLMALVSDEDARLTRQLADSWAFRRRLLAAVPESLRVSRDDLLGWAKGTGADQELPRLLRRLIRETTQVERIEFRSGTGVATPGWDGIVECVEGNQFVPDGRSGWEVSVQQSGSDQKARADYDKRVKEVGAEQRREMDYVAVVCAPWTKARDFENEKRTLGDFRSVRAFNVDALEDWLECAPSTTVWLRDLMGEPVVGVGLLSAWWAKWLGSTTPALDASVVLAGRDGNAERLRNLCKQPGGGVVTIGGQVHRDEILAFVAAGLVSPDDPDGQDQSPVDALYVDDHGAAKRLLAAEAAPTPSPHTRALTVVVPSADFAEHLPAGSRHRMIVPIPGGSQTEIVLEAADAAVAAERLRAAGVDHDRADELGSLARMSLMALRRHLAVNPEVHRPRWATGPVEETLRRSLLLNGWDQSRDGDREIVERFVGRPHDEIAETLNGLAGLDSGDAPMILTGDIRHVVSPMDTWVLLDHQLTPADIEDFAEIAQEVLTEPDPLHGTAGLERMQAQYDGVRAKHSSTMKRGAATTLALLGSQPPTLLGSVTPALTIADGIVRRILRSANEDESPRTWNVVAEVLPLLAEAGPEAVLAGLRTCLAAQHAFATAMFADRSLDDLGFPPPSPHPRVLDALDVLAWSPNHLMAVFDVLGTLAGNDPGGRYANRPAESLAAIVCPWKPYTSASADDRLAAVRMLRRSHGRVAWSLMLSMLPGSRNVQMPERRPKYRDWKQAEPVVTQREYGRVAASVAESLLEDVGDDPGRWVNLIDHFVHLSDQFRRKAITVLDRLADASPDETFKSRVWPKLRDYVNRHRQYSDAKWALPETELAPLDYVLERLRPAEPTILYGHLFSSRMMYVDGVGAVDGWEIFQEALGKRQAEAVEAILRGSGIEAVLEFAESVDQPLRVGSALACIAPTLDVVILREMDAAPEVVTQVALGYFGQRFKSLGWEGIDQLLTDHDLSPRVVADLLRAPPPVELPWTRVDVLGGEVAAEYWARVTYYDIGIPSGLDQLLKVSQRLRDACRADFALMLLCLGSESHGSQPELAEEAAACLELRLTEGSGLDSPKSMLDGYEFTVLMGVLDKHREHLGEGRVARLEWQYYPLLQNDPDFKAPNLYRGLAVDPDFFAWLVELAFKPSNTPPGQPRASSAANDRMALNAFSVLRSWPPSRFAPALDDEGRVDADQLGVWVDRARERLAETQRVEIGDQMIGGALAASPPDPNGDWPGIAVRGLLERLQSDNVDRGLIMAVINQRGVTCRSPNDGGEQERELAESYNAQLRQYREWPRTAAIFANLAQGYEHEAGIHDREAEDTRRGLPI